jgi:hypothetical protein
MKKKLLNLLKNLIIILTLVSIVNLLLSTSVFAVVSENSNVSFSQYMKENISLWFTIIRTTCFGIMLITFIIFMVKFMIFNNNPENLALLKSMVVDWIIGLVLLFCIHYFMIAIMQLNEYGISQAKTLGSSLSGLAEGENANEEEYSLYEQALSKAYEINASSGLIGLLMYIMLVVYTYKFVIIYAKRYINVIVLIIISPIVIVISSFKKILSGKSVGMLRKWFKEFIYNVLIQTVHAMFYACCIGLTIKLSADKETYVGAILTLVLFGFIFKLDGFIRKIFNFVGGKTTIKRIDMSGTINNFANMDSEYKANRDLSIKNGETYQNRFKYYGGMAKNGIESKASEIGNSAVTRIKSVRNIDNILEGEKIKVSSSELAKEAYKRNNSENILDKALYATNSNARAIIGSGIDLGLKAANQIEKMSNKGKKKFNELYNSVKNDINNLEENTELVKRMPVFINAQENKILPSVMVDNPELHEAYKTVIDLNASGREVIEAIRDKIENGVNDIVAIVYNTVGPQAFLYPQIGSPYMGMQMLAEQNYENKITQYYFESSVQLRTLKLAKHSKKAESVDVLDKNGNVIASNVEKQKKYTFNRFGTSATRKIVHRLERHAIMSDSYLKVINNVSGKINMGELRARGNVGIRETEVKYKARLNSSAIRKQQSILKLTKFEERRNDGKWAQISSVIAEGKFRAQNSMHEKLSKLQQAPASQVAMQTLVRMGKAYNIDKKVALVADNLTREIVKPIAPAYNAINSVSKSINSKIEGLENVIKDASEARKILSGKPNEKNEATTSKLSVVNNSDVNNSDAKNSGVNSPDVNLVQTTIKQVQFSNLTQEEKEQAITDRVLVDVAINTGVYKIEELNLEENVEARIQVIDSLIENGIVSTSVKEDENESSKVIKSMQARTVELSEMDKNIVLESIAQQEYANIVTRAIENGEVTADTIDSLDIDSKLNNLSDVIQNAARETLEEEAINSQKAKSEAKFEREVKKELQKIENKKSKGKNSESDTNQIVKVTLRFSGAVSVPFISVTLTNKDTISEFLDKAMPLPTASKAKTQDYFNKIYSAELGGIEYSFDKYASETMDGWEIYVVDEREDIGNEASKREEDKLLERELARMELEKKISRLMPQFVEIIGKFMEENQVKTLEELYENKKLRTEIVAKLVREFRRENISRMQFTELIERLDHYKEFRNLAYDLKHNENEKEVKQKAKELILEQKKKMTVVKLDDANVDEEDTKADREREGKALEAEAENNTIEQSSLDVIQSIFDTMNSEKILVGTSEKKVAQQQLYMTLNNNQKSRIA